LIDLLQPKYSITEKRQSKKQRDEDFKEKVTVLERRSNNSWMEKRREIYGFKESRTYFVNIVLPHYNLASHFVSSRAGNWV
jgi:hypothetical protein